MLLVRASSLFALTITPCPYQCLRCHKIHPNAWGFIRCFETVCRRFDLEPSFQVFLYLMMLWRGSEFDIGKEIEKRKRKRVQSTDMRCSHVIFCSTSKRATFKSYLESCKRNDLSFKHEYYKVIATPIDDKNPNFCHPVCWDVAVLKSRGSICI